MSCFNIKILHLGHSDTYLVILQIFNKENTISSLDGVYIAGMNRDDYYGRVRSTVQKIDNYQDVGAQLSELNEYSCIPQLHLRFFLVQYP